MKNVMPAFERWVGNERELPPVFQNIKCHFIFDIKVGKSFRRKARLVANGNETETPAALTYSSVVSRDSVRIALLIASLNELEVLACDIQNAYLTADCREKIYIIAGPEFASLEGSIMIIRKGLYGLYGVSNASCGDFVRFELLTYKSGSGCMDSTGSQTRRFRIL